MAAPERGSNLHERNSFFSTTCNYMSRDIHTMTNNTIRRVISECDDMADGITRSDEANINDSTNPYPGRFYPQYERPASVGGLNFVGGYNVTISDMTLSSRADPMDVEGAPLTLIESNVEREGQYQDSSSLSCDDSEGTATDLNMLVLNERHSVHPPNYTNPIDPINDDNDGFQRRDSNSYASGQSSQRAPSSQNSDWGFFEDVHQSSDGKISGNARIRKDARQPTYRRVNKDNSKF